MAELDTSSGGGKKGPGVKKAKKLSTRIDLTPMVDLGFLLITFFIFTTTMSKPKAMSLVMPTDEKLPEEQMNKVKASTALTALLGKDHRIYYYYGIGDNPAVDPGLKVTTFKAKDGIRDAIIELKKRVAEKIASGELLPKDKATVLIKPDTTSTYEDVVNILDEMAINEIDIYAIIDISPVDRGFILATENANKGVLAPATPPAK
jgi:biopolymer transport protein ExbD